MSGVDGPARNGTSRYSSSPELSSPPCSPSDPGSPAARQLLRDQRDAQDSSIVSSAGGVVDERGKYTSVHIFLINFTFHNTTQHNYFYLCTFPPPTTFIFPRLRLQRGDISTFSIVTIITIHSFFFTVYLTSHTHSDNLITVQGK